MNLNQLFTQPSVTPRTQGFTQLHRNLVDLLAHEHTEAVFIEFSEGVRTSSRYAHKDLYEALAAQHDLYAPGLPDAFGFIHTFHQTTIVWYLYYFAAGNWQRIPANIAVTTRHNCLLEVMTLTEIELRRQ